MDTPHALDTSAGGCVVWLTGLPSSGKSTLAERVRLQLLRANRGVCVLDGDRVRQALVPRPGFAPPERDAFYATLGRLAGLLAHQGLIVIVAATAHQRAYRTDARALAPRFLEVLVETSAAECARRDAKGLFAAARAGRISGVPGLDVAYEPPLVPDVIALGGCDDEAAAQIEALVMAKPERPK